VALVTGASRGIGRAIAVELARNGATVVVNYARSPEAAAEVVATITSAGGKAWSIQADVAVEEQVDAMVKTVLEREGRLDVMVNNAGITRDGLLMRMKTADWHQVLDLNLTGVFLCCKHELRHMAPAGRGAIVNTSSGAGVVGVAGLGHYAAAKHGVLGLTKSAAIEHARSGVRVNAICPGTTDTPMIRGFMDANPGAAKFIVNSVGRGSLGQPDEVAQAAVWLCSDRASFVNGESLMVDGATVCR
jgi:3-oxoacyl-[acyl-carrier protein] reductase